MKEKAMGTLKLNHIQPNIKGWPEIHMELYMGTKADIKYSNSSTYLVSTLSDKNWTL